MFINGRQAEEGALFQSEVCIIGGGVAGITMGLELARKGIDVCILESGGHTPDNATRDLYRGENVGLPYMFSDGCRSRYLGGSSNCWGGWCAPLDAVDFETRPWVSDSGWPVSLEDLEPYYKRSHEVLKLGPYNYDPLFWEKAIDHPEVKRISSDISVVTDKISQFSPPARMGILYKHELTAKNLLVFLHSNVTDIECNEDGNKINRVKVTSLRGNTFYISADQFVLATGGIENARLLLSSDKVHKNGLGNDNDLVGRYFMDHPRLLSGSISFTKKWVRNRLYDIKYNYHSPVVSALGTCIASQLALTPEAQEKEGLLNARVSFSSRFPGEGTTGALALWRFKQAFFKKESDTFRAGRELVSIISNPVDATSYGITRFYRPRYIVKDVNFQIIVEQEPNPQSRIMLSSEKDQLGMRRVKVNWHTGLLERITVDKTLAIIANRLQTLGITQKIVPGKKLAETEWPQDLEGAWHHMGTTRMHNSPKKGVVDKDCKVHGIENLYVAGSSVFPTGGANFPTITLTALAIRLSDHICQKLATGAVKVEMTYPSDYKIYRQKETG